MSGNVVVPSGLCAKVAEWRREARRVLALGPADPAPDPERVRRAWQILRQHGAREGAPRFPTLDPNSPRAA